MSTEEIEAFVRELDEYVCQHELCVYPEKQTFDKVSPHTRDFSHELGDTI